MQMKNVKKFRAFLGGFILFLALMFTVDSVDVKAAGPKLNKKKITIAKGKSAKIKATVTYTNDNLRKHVPALRYLSSDTKIATVNSKGVIKGKKKGTCTI